MTHIVADRLRTSCGRHDWGMPSAAPPPLVAEITVPVSPTQAFVGFTAQMGEWWDPLLTPDPATFTSVEIDPQGEVAMVHEEDRFVWGRVTSWDPSGRLTMDFWLAHEQSAPTTLDVQFTEEGSGTRIRLEHGGWPVGSDEVRDRYTHWDDLLARFAAHVS